jgi:superfamily II DNA or RNA helicase
MTQEERNQLKSLKQFDARQAWEAAGHRGTIAMATGVGKSKIAVDRVCELGDEWFQTEGQSPKPEILLVTPTEKMRDENWPAEFAKWGITGFMENLVKRICFASLKNEVGNKYKLVILDEIHRLTEYNSEGFKDSDLLFLADNMAEEVMGLTATVPDPERDSMKALIINQIAPVCFNYPLDQAVADGVLPGYQIVIIQIPLDKIAKVIPGGTKLAPFKQTEAAAYSYLGIKLKKAFASKKKGWIDALTGERRRMIATLPSKTRVLKKVIDRVVFGEKKRTIIFCGGIDQSRELCGLNVYNSSPEDKKRGMLEAFKKGDIDYCGVVDAVNEGHNIDGIERGIIGQVNSNERDIIQRLGRVMRGEDPLIYITVAQGTQDEKWLAEALKGLDPKRIRYDSYMNWIL